ncbi:MAG: TIGR03435 family protein, partial [Vicinamibacterales bacterium]
MGQGLAAAMLLTAVVAAQVTSPAFEVASIRVNNTGGTRGGVTTPRGNQWIARNANVRTLVRFAYGSDGDELTPALRDEFLVVGGPSWIDTEAFDILAKMPEVPARKLGDSALMLQKLLAERFSLKVHTETRELPAWALVRARRDGTLRPELRPTSGKCVPQSERVSREQIRCGVSGAFQGLIANSASMTHFAATLSRILGRTVVD